MGHFLEHLMPVGASPLLALIANELPEGACASAVVPDMRAIFGAYAAGEISNLELNYRYVYSYEQPSHHVWCHDASSLATVFDRRRIPRRAADRPAHLGARLLEGRPRNVLQCGVRAVVPASSTSQPRIRSTSKCHLRSRFRWRPTRCCSTGSGSCAPRSRALQRGATNDETLACGRSGRRPAPPVRRAAGRPARGRPGPAGSMFDRLPRSVVPVARRLLPVGSRQRRLARFSVESAVVGALVRRVIRVTSGSAPASRRPGTPTYDTLAAGTRRGAPAWLARTTVACPTTLINPLFVNVIVTHPGKVVPISIARFGAWSSSRGGTGARWSSAMRPARAWSATSAIDRIEFRAAVPDAMHLALRTTGSPVSTATSR